MEAEAFRYREQGRSYHSGSAGRLAGPEAAVSRAVVYDVPTAATYLLAAADPSGDDPAPPPDCFRVIFTTGRYRPPARVAIAAGPTGFREHLDGSFAAGRWTFELRGDQFRAPFSFKLTLDHVSFMRGDDRAGEGGSVVYLDDAAVRFEEHVVFHTAQWAPNHLVTLRTVVDGWSRDIFGAYADGAWRFALDRGMYPAAFEAKFVLDRRTFMEGPDLRIAATNDERHEFTERDVFFRDAPAALLHGYDRFHSIESAFEQRTVRARGSERELYDVIVIGSGMGGGVLADRLSDSGVRTLVLEAGGLWFPLHTNELTGNWMPLAERDHIGSFENEAVDGVGSDFKAGVHFSLGGRSVYWSGLIPRMCEWEFRDVWPAPVRDYLLQGGGYDAAEALVHKQVTGGPFQDRVAAHIASSLGAGFKVSALPRSLHQPGVAADGRLGNVIEKPMGVFSTADLLLDSLGATGPAGTDNLALNLHHLAVRLETDGSRVTGVLCHDLAGNVERRYRGRHVVLACGSLESPRLALDSGLRDPNGRIGRGLTDHPAWFYQVHPQLPAGSAFADQLAHAKLLVQHENSSASLHAYNVEVLVNPTFWDFRHADRDVGETEIRRRGRSWAEVKFVFDSPLDERNRIVSRGLGRKLGVHVRRNGRAELFRDELDELRYRIFDALDLGQNNPPRGWFGPDWHHGNEGTVHHAGGSMRMSDDGSGAVDADLRFETYDNVYCCDCSIWPSIPAANPALTLVGLALRLADTLKARL